MQRVETIEATCLDPATADAVEQEVVAAKARGWLQADLRSFFHARQVTHDIYKSAIAGGPVPDNLLGFFSSLSITGLPDQPRVPQPESIRQHIEWLIEPALGRYDDALIEIAFDGPGRGPTAARLFGLDEIDEAVAFAAAQNAKRSNIYIGAALRLPDADRGHRASSEDFYVATAVPMDIDRDYDATRAKMATICDDGLVVVTGMTPERRSQHWARLIEPCDNDIEFGSAFAALVHHTGADMAVKDSARIMRLGGTVSYPNERKVGLGYCTELASITINEGAQPVALETLRALAPGTTTGGSGGDYSDRPAGNGIEYGGGKFGSLVRNGREEFFRNLLIKEIAKYQAENGADPDEAELFDAAFERFQAEADNTDGRWTGDHGQGEFRKRVSNTLRRLRAGRIARAGLYSIETEAGRDIAEEVARNRIATDQAAVAIATETVRAAGAIQASPYQWVDAAKIRPRDVLYGRHLFRKFLSATVAPGGLGKSSLEIVEALAMVTGRELLDEVPKGPLSVWYWNGEDPMEELQRRIAAACLHYQIKPDDIAGRLYVDSGRETAIVVAREDRGAFTIAVPVVEALIEQIRSRGIDVLIIDPFVASHEVSENNNTLIEAVAKQWMRIADEGDCAVELVHHVRKPGGAVQETTVDDARGAGALLAKTRSARVLNAMTKTEADEIGVEGKQRFSFFRVDNGKANLMPRGGDAKWRRMIGVPLGNRIDAAEDEIGVAVTWQKPDAFDGVKEHHLSAVLGAVALGEWREDIRASNWVGLPVAGALGLDLDDPRDKARVKSMIRTWIRNGVLNVVQGFDQARRPKQFVVIGEVE